MMDVNNTVVVSQRVMGKYRSQSPLRYHLLNIGADVELDEKCLKTFVDEDDFIISLDYDSADGTCDITLAGS
ncbi:hypothetical protein QZH41_020239 [Actinostola sp. cb2023]|nr:hypothetical protein QZH41_020239 [Actinostola sp. cb2023]